MLSMACLLPIFISAICFAFVFNRIGADSVNFPAGEDDVLQKPKYVGSYSELQLKIQQLESSLVEKTKELKEKDNEIALLYSKITSLQEELKTSKFVAQSNINEVMEVNGGWLPIPVARYLSDLEKKLKEHGKPSADAILQKAVEKKAESVRWAGPHIETIKTKWIPAVKDQWLTTSANIAPHVQSLRDRSRDSYVASKSAVIPHVLKVQELADPYFQAIHGYRKWIPAVKEQWLTTSANIAPHVQSLRDRSRDSYVASKSAVTPHVLKVQELADPYFQKWIPAVKEQWLTTSANIAPHVQSLRDRSRDSYVASKSAVTPHVLKVQELADPYFQEVKKFSKPYIEYIDSFTRPYLDKLESSLVEKTKELKEKDNEIALLHSKITSLQEELKKSNFVAQSNINEVMEVNGGWLPIPVAGYLSDLEKKWKEHGKPSADAILQKAVEKKAEAVRWAGPHIETIKTNWVPAVKERWLITSANIKPRVLSLCDRAHEAYVASKSAVTPHVLKVQELADPYFQEVKKFGKPYIDRIDSITRPYLDKLGIVLKPCMKIAVHVYGKFIKPASKIAVHVYGKFTNSASKIAVHVYGKFIKSASVNNHQAQGNVQENLKQHELTKKAIGSETNSRRTTKHRHLDQ